MSVTTPADGRIKQGRESERSSGPDRSLRAAALGLSVTALVASLVPGSSRALNAADFTLIGQLTGEQVASGLMLAISAVAVIASAIGLTPGADAGRSHRTGRTLLAVAVLSVAGYGIALQGVRALSTTGYLLAFAMPAGLIVLIIQVIRRYPRLRLPSIAMVIAVLAAGFGFGLFRPASVLELLTNLGQGVLATGWTIPVSLLLVALSIVWGLIGIRLVRGTPTTRRMTAFVLRHRTAVTVIAAAGPLPYALVRMTWLTPWPLMAPGTELMDPELRLWGLLLGSGAVLGVVLTLGLIRPWGERFPRWVPRLAGRPVPVAVAAIPGSVVAAVVSSSALPMLVQLTLTTGGAELGMHGLLVRVSMAFIFPLWLWGPALALAVWGYVAHRGKM